MLLILSHKCKMQKQKKGPWKLESNRKFEAPSWWNHKLTDPALKKIKKNISKELNEAMADIDLSKD